MKLLGFILIFVVVFFAGIVFLFRRQRQADRLKSWSEKLGTLCYFVVLTIVLVTFIVGIFYLAQIITWSDIKETKGEWDYLNALATIIGACISLIPIFWLIGQNKLIRRQMQQDKEGLEQQLKSQKEQNTLTRAQLDLQEKQNNADMFARACQMLTSEKHEEVSSGLYLLESLISVEQGKYVAIILSVLKFCEDESKHNFILTIFTDLRTSVILSQNKKLEEDFETHMIFVLGVAMSVIQSMDKIGLQLGSMAKLSNYLGANFSTIVRDSENFRLFKDFIVTISKVNENVVKKISDKDEQIKKKEEVYSILRSKIREYQEMEDLDVLKQELIGLLLKATS